MKWWANENGSPSSPASRALKSLEPSSQIAGMLPAPGTAVIRGNVPEKNASSSRELRRQIVRRLGRASGAARRR